MSTNESPLATDWLPGIVFVICFASVYAWWRHRQRRTRHASDQLSPRNQRMGLQRNLFERPVSDLSLRPAIVVSPQTTLAEVVDQMKQKDLGGVVVVDDSSNTLGVFTESVLVRLLAEHQGLPAGPVSQFMDTDYARTRTTDRIAHVIRAMREKDTRFVCVTDGFGKPVGLTGQRGIVEYVSEHFPRHVQKMISRVGEKSYPNAREGA